MGLNFFTLQRHKFGDQVVMSKGLPSKVGYHLAGTASGIVIPFDESGCTGLACL
jgi:hypothetical protein